MDVFAGVGGLSIGLEQAGVAEAKWAIEYVKDAANAFKVLSSHGNRIQTFLLQNLTIPFFQANHQKCRVMLEDCNTVLRHALKGSNHLRKTRIPKKGPCSHFTSFFVALFIFTIGYYR